MKKFSLIALVFFAQAFAFAQTAPTIIRWTAAEDQDASLAHVIDVVNQKTGQSYTAADFLLQEDRPLAFTQYQRYEQVVASVPIDGNAIRVWTDLTSHHTIQVEAAVSVPTAQMKAAKFAAHLGSLVSETEAIKLARAEVMKSNDPFVRGLDVKERFVNGVLSRIVTIKGKHGKHRVVVSEQSHQIASSRYQSFPEADVVSYPAMIFPVYEERASNGQILPRVAAPLTNLYTSVAQVTGDVFAPLKQQHYYDFNFSPVLGATAAGRALGKWSMTYVKEQAAALRASLPMIPNQFSTGFLLQGKYATISIHPDAFTHYQGITFGKAPAAAFFPNWVDAVYNGNPVTEMIPDSGFYGKPLLSSDEILTRPAIKYADNDPASLMNDGFDEIQVYYAINTLMEQLGQRGFTDPDLSTRPFNAFLFNPDVEYRDNAFYTDDTINFTTYSTGSVNDARDNSTIWHELGHGVMDRLMGDNITLADTGGLSEGMADFVAAMIIRGVTQGTPFPGSDEFRIINKTGFFLTNEVHDDGEAYGGTMKDFMDAVTTRDGQAGLAKVTDVVLEAMRLTRDHPALTASIWFQHILFADSLGRPGVRAPGELAPLLLGALNGRNFKLDGGNTASFKLIDVTDNREVVSGVPGSRDHPIPLKLALDGTAHFDLTASLKSSDEYTFAYPVTVKVVFNGGPLQGSVHWVDEEKGARTYTLNSEADVANIPLDVTGKCDAINRQDGSCVDFAYVQILDQKDLVHPHAKKRFYVQIKN